MQTFYMSDFYEPFAGMFCPVVELISNYCLFDYKEKAVFLCNLPWILRLNLSFIKFHGKSGIHYLYSLTICCVDLRLFLVDVFNVKVKDILCDVCHVQGLYDWVL